MDITTVMGLTMADKLIVLVLAIWSLFWKCYSVWTAAKNNHRWWFLALVIFNTIGILDMIYIFAVAKKKLTDVKEVLLKSVFPKQ